MDGPTGGTDLGSLVWSCLRREDLEPHEVRQGDELLADLASGDVAVVALGEFKRGKSSLLNALVGMPVLPVDVVPHTAIVTVLRRGERTEATVVTLDGERFPARLDDLAAYVTESGNPGNEKRVARVEVSLEDGHLPRHVLLIDTPGLGSVYEEGTAVTLGFLPRVDVALLVLSAEQALSESEAKLARRLADDGAVVMVALNRSDLLGENDVERARSFVSQRLAALGVDCQVFATSARVGTRHDGVDALRASLFDLVRRRRDALRDRRVRRLLGGWLNDLSLAYAGRRAALRRDEEQLLALTADLSSLRRRALAEAEDAEAVFDHQVRRIRDAIAERGTELGRQLAARLSGRLGDLEEALRENASERTVDAFLERLIVSDLEAACERELAWLRAELQTVVDVFSRRLDALGAELARETSALLDVHIEPPHPLSIEPELPPVTAKVHDEQVALELISGSLTAAMPTRLRRRLLLRRARERAGQLADRHAGRLRAALTDALGEAQRKALRQARAEFDRLLDGIGAALAACGERRAHGHAAAAADLARVSRVLAGITALRQALGIDAGTETPGATVR